MYLTENMVGWHHAWAALAKVHGDIDTRDEDGEGWEYIGTSESGKAIPRDVDPDWPPADNEPREPIHCFRHRNKGGFTVSVMADDEVEIGWASRLGAQLVLNNIAVSLAAMEKAPRMWGGSEALTLQFLALLEVRQTLLRPKASMVNPSEVNDAYCAWLATMTTTCFPLHVVLQIEDRIDELPKTLGDFGRRIATEYPAEKNG